jgi:hypothetical protein
MLIQAKLSLLSNNYTQVISFLAAVLAKYVYNDQYVMPLR